MFFNYTDPDDQPLTSAALNCTNSTERIRINKDGKNVRVEIIKLEKGDEEMCSLTTYLQVGDGKRCFHLNVKPTARQGTKTLVNLFPTY